MTRIITLCLYSLNIIAQPYEIFEGKTLLSYVYYDHNKSKIIIEIGGPYFGYHDRLYPVNVQNKHIYIIAKSETGKLYKKKENLHYCNNKYKIHIRLKKKTYSSKIDYRRMKIYNIKAHFDISKLKEQLKIKDYEFDWNTELDYKDYRDSLNLDEAHVPRYIKKFLKVTKNYKR